MKNQSFFKQLAKIGVLSILLAVGGWSVQAQAKLGIVDMKKVFDNYYKTKQAEANIKEEAANSDKVYKGMLEDYKRLNDEYKKLLDGSNDQALSADERDKRKKSAESKLLEIQETEKQVKEFDKQARARIGTMEKRMREKIVDEIRDLVNMKAKAGGYSIIFDIAAQTAYQTPFILYSNGENDLTESVLKDINATAPADLPFNSNNAKSAKPGSN
jgi:outer membrane protein